MSRRRATLAALGAGLLARGLPVALRAVLRAVLPAALPAFAQQAPKPSDKNWRVGFLAPRGRPASLDADFIGGFPVGMRERGYVEGKNLLIEWRFADGDLARLPALAAELVQLKVDAIVASGPQAVRAAQQATTTIPIVMGIQGDPVVEGFVASLARPGGNITGPTGNAGDIYAKRLEMLLEISPRLSRIAYLMNPGNVSHVAAFAAISAAARIRKVTILPVEARASQDIDAAFAHMRRGKAGGVIMVPDPIFNDRVRHIAQLALQQRLPLISAIREYVEAGCLMSYGANFRDNFRRGAYYVDRIFKGAKPADLPVEQPTRFELFINGKTAKALGLKIPHSLLITAEKVIE